MIKDSTFQAFVDASAGSVGALLVAITLYPIDIAKTLKQAHIRKDKTIINTTNIMNNKVNDNEEYLNESMWYIIQTIIKKEGISELFRGLGPKSLHTITSNFMYFYFYSFIQKIYSKKYGKITPSVNLVIASIAGILNMTCTLPLEMITTRIQICEKDNNKTNTKHNTFLDITKKIYKEEGICGFWKSYIVSLILVTNPAINYTIFDQLKLILFRTKNNNNNNTLKKNKEIYLNIMESFLLGAISKIFATIITYPLIRAKVLMQASKNNTNLIHMLYYIWKMDGFVGLFKGCNAQLTNTVLKSSLLMMTKEQITSYIIKCMYILKTK